MALGIGQSASAGTGTGSSKTTAGITTSVGSGIVVVAFFGSAQLFGSITENKGNRPPIQIDTQQSNGTGRVRCYYWPRLDVAGAGHTFTVTLSGSATPAPSIGVCEITTNGLGIRLNTISTYVVDTTSPYATNSTTTTQSNEMVINFSTVDATGTTNHTDSGAGFTLRTEMADSANGWGVGLASKFAATTGTHNANWTVSGTVTGVGGYVASFIEVPSTDISWITA